MKYVKMLGLAALAAALMAFAVAGTASATTLTSNGETLGAGTKIASEAEGTTTLHPPIGDIECKESTVAGEITNAGGSTSTVSGPIGSLTFSGCNAEVVVLEPGSLEIHTEYETVIDHKGEPNEEVTSIQKSVSTNNGTLTSSGAKVTVTFIGFHCIFTTSNTDIGTLTGSATTGGTATLDIKATIPRTGGRSGAFCGKEAAWTGSYKVTNPDNLNVD